MKSRMTKQINTFDEMIITATSGFRLFSRIKPTNSRLSSDSVAYPLLDHSRLLDVSSQFEQNSTLRGLMKQIRQ